MNKNILSEREIKQGSQKKKPVRKAKLSGIAPKNEADLNILITDAIKQWKEEFNNNIVKTDSIADLEKLVKLNLLLINEKEKYKTIIDNILLKMLEILKSSIEYPEQRIAIYEKLKALNYDDFS